jgi:hypothetical protein
MVMFLVTVLASFVALATRVTADQSDHPDSHHRRYDSGHTVPLTKHNPGPYNPVQSDQRRLMRLMNKANFSNLVENTAGLNLTSFDDWRYMANISVGVPPTYCKSCLYFLSGIQSSIWAILDSLQVDTGSSNTWVGGNAPYVRTNTSVNTSDFMVSIASYLDRWSRLDQLKPKSYGSARALRLHYFHKQV